MIGFVPQKNGENEEEARAGGRGGVVSIEKIENPQLSKLVWKRFQFQTAMFLTKNVFLGKKTF